MQGEAILFENKQNIRFAISVSHPKRGGRCTIIPSGNRKPKAEKTLIASLRKAHQLVRTQRSLPLVEKAPSSPRESKLLRMAFLASDIQSDIMKGLQPPSLNLQRLKQLDIPLAWEAQRKVLGWMENNTPCSS